MPSNIADASKCDICTIDSRPSPAQAFERMKAYSYW